MPVDNEPSLSVVVTHLMKGVVYRDVHEQQWRQLLRLQSQVQDYVGVIGLIVIIDEAEGYAFLRSRPDLDEQDGPPIPRLVPRRALSFQVSLLLALLRRKLAEFDAKNTDSRLVLDRDEIVNIMRTFVPAGSTEARMVEQIDTTIGKIVDLGFLRRVKGDGTPYEVRRILKAYVDGQWLADFDARLAAYAASMAAESPS